MELLQVPKPIRDRVFIAADPFKNTVKDSGIVIDNAFERYATEHVTQEGTVLQPPQKLSNGKEIEIERGDYVYTHHFLCDPDQKVQYGQHSFYQLLYELVHCKVKDGEVTMIGDWNLIDPITKEETITKSGIILPVFEKDNEPKLGIARHLSPYMQSLGVKPDEEVYFTSNSDYEIIIEGTTYWRMRDRDIIGKS